MGHPGGCDKIYWRMLNQILQAQHQKVKSSTPDEQQNPLSNNFTEAHSISRGNRNRYTGRYTTNNKQKHAPTFLKSAIKDEGGRPGFSLSAKLTLTFSGWNETEAC